MKAKTNYHIVWTVCAVLAGVVLIGGAVLVCQVAADPVAFYRWGMQIGLLDAEAGVDFGPDIAADPRAALLYLLWLPTRIEICRVPTNAAERRVREGVLRQASLLAERAFQAAPEQRWRYSKAFVAGYRLGHRLKQTPRSTHARARRPTSTRRGTGR